MTEGNNQNLNEPDGSKAKPNPDGGGENKKTYTEEEYKSVLSESISRRKELDDIKSKLKKFEDEKLSDTEKKDKRIKELEDEITSVKNATQAEKVDNLILKGLTGKNVVDSDTAMLLIRKELANVENIDDKAVSKVIDDVLKAKPFLISGSDPNPSNGNFKNNPKDQSQDVDTLFGKMIRNTKGS